MQDLTPVVYAPALQRTKALSEYKQSYHPRMYETLRMGLVRAEPAFHLSSFPRKPFYRYHVLHREIEPILRAHGTPIIGIFERQPIPDRHQAIRGGNQPIAED